MFSVLLSRFSNEIDAILGVLEVEGFGVETFLPELQTNFPPVFRQVYFKFFTVEVTPRVLQLAPALTCVATAGNVVVTIHRARIEQANERLIV